MKYNHKKASFVILTISIILILIESVKSCGGWAISECIIFSLLHIALVTIVTYLFYKNGLASQDLKFRKYILAPVFLLSLVIYDIAFIINFINPVKDFPFLLGFFITIVLYGIPIIVVISILTLLLEVPKYLKDRRKK